MAVECSGAESAQRLCIDATRRQGQVAFVGESMQKLAVTVSSDLIRKGLTLIGSWHYNLADFPQIMQVVRRSPLIDQLISHVFPMSQIQAAFETCASYQTAKVLLKPWE
jgi:threonine dehydrogenase-like Zn-dependent dehydrogenase